MPALAALRRLRTRVLIGLVSGVAVSTAAVRAQEGPGPVETGATTLEAVVADAAPPPVAPEVISRDEAGRTTVRASRIDGPLAVDGRLDDEVYRRVRSFGDFVQQEPVEGAPATQRTEVWLLFDDEHLYVSARCWQDASVRPVANELRRDGQTVFDNDSFAVVLDTFRDRRNGVTFQTNPLGVIVDQQMSDEGAGMNRDWNAVWEARVSRDAEGWSVEMALPFKSLRFPPGRTQVWGINLRRNIQARSEYTYLAPIPASAGRRGLMRVSRAATLVGLEIARPVRQLEVKPYLTSMLSTDREALPPTRDDLDTRVGLDVRAGLGHGLSADVTLFTDFAQVEEDEAQVNLSRFSLYQPEKREFFLEGQGLFSFGGVPAGRQGGPAPIAPAIFFSRRVGLADDAPVQILAGARVTGRLGPWSVGAIQIRQDASPDTEPVLPVTDFSVLRVRRDLFGRSSVGAIYTRRAPTEDGVRVNQVGGVDLLLAPTQTLTVNAYLARSDTPGRRGDDLSYRARLDYASDRYGLEAEHLVVGTDFDPDVGLLRREDFQRDFLEGRVSRRPAGSRWLRRWTLQASVDYVTDNDRVLESREQDASARFEFTNGDSLRVDAQQAYEVLDEAFDLTDEHTVPVGAYGFRQWSANYELGPRHRVTGSVGATTGRFYDGTLREAHYRGRVEVSPAMSLEPNVAVNRVVRPGTGTIWINVAALRANWALSPRAVASTLVQYSSGSSSLTASARLRWEYRPGSDVFLVYSEGRDTLDGRTPLLNRSLALKVSRLIRF